MTTAEYKEIQQNFLQELRNASTGKKTSLPFIVNKIPTEPLVADNEVFQVLVIGGSVMKKSLAKKHDDTITIITKEERAQPAFKTKEAFLQYVEQEIDDDVRVVALNFAYPLSPVFENDRLDGILMFGTKENTFEGLAGEKVALSIEQHIKKQKNRDIVVTVANDTICLLLSGLTVSPWDSLAGGIVGTGLNFAMFVDKDKIVNLESANFDKFPQTEEGKIIDQTSSAPGKALFEKEAAGAYLYQHFNLMVDAKKVVSPKLESTWELKKLALKNVLPSSSAARKLIDHAAALVACQIGGITQFQDKNMIFMMEGSFFWDKNIFKEAVKKHLQKILPEREITFIKIDDSPIVGGAKLVC